MAKSFPAYLKRAVSKALEDERTRADNENLQWIHELARRGVRKNWAGLTPKKFLEQYLWCVGSIQKRYDVHEAHFKSQKALFRQCNASAIKRNEAAMRASWRKEKCDLNSRMFEAVVDTARRVAADWAGFRREYLLLPDNPESDTMDDWRDAYDALDSLPMVGDAIAWYLIRNLYGAPFFKPDVHITAIVDYFFGPGRLGEMSKRVRELWPQVCSDPRLKPVHLGEVDYILWWHRRATDEPPMP